YILVFTAWMVIFAALSRVREWLGRRHPPPPAALVGGGAIAVAPLAPHPLAYPAIHRGPGFQRSVEVTRHYARAWRDYLASGSRLHYQWWSKPFVDRVNSDLFPGVAALLLVAAGGVWPESRRDPRFRMCAAAAVGCAAVGLVPNAPFYPFLYRAIPL